MSLRMSVKELEAMTSSSGARKAVASYRKAISAKKSTGKPGKVTNRSKEPSALELLFDRQVVGAGLPTPVKELKFHSVRRWRFDFAFKEYQVAVEIEGGTYSHGKEKNGKEQKSRHLTPTGFYNDCHKYAEAAILGWTVIRADAKMIKNGEALELVHRAMVSRGFKNTVE